VAADVVMDRFQILERLGSGGMGVVYRALDERLQRQVAVKEIHQAGSERVLREAQAAARLNHPAIATLYELGERNGHAVLVSELVRGRTLDELARAGELSDRDVAEVGADLCDALVHAHERGVVHRDIKPQNIMVRPPDQAGRRAKLMDFGIAAIAGAPTLTATGEVVGTLAYMAPEQAEGEEVGPEADVYSLALTLYEAWTGTNPVAGRTPAQTARRIGREIRSLAREREDLPAELADVIDACLLPEPHMRPGPEELGDVLRRVAPELDDEYAVPGAEVEEGEREWNWRAPTRVAALAGLGAALAALAGPAGRPGLTLALAAIIVPALAVARSALHAALPFAAIPLGAVGALAAFPVLVGVACERWRERAVLGGLGFAAYLVGAAGFGAGPRAGIAPVAAEDWQRSAGSAAHDLLLPMLDPHALLGIAALAAGSVAIALALRAHLAVAMVAAMIWAAGITAALAAVGNGVLGEGSFAAVLAGAAAVAYEAHRRARSGEPQRPAGEGDPLAGAQPMLHGGR
jgi:hypothetical protein